MSYSIRDLIDALENYLTEGLDEETEVRLLNQPSWPLQTTLGGVSVIGDEDENPPAASAVKVLYLVEGSSPDDSPYGPSFGRLVDEVIDDDNAWFREGPL